MRRSGTITQRSDGHFQIRYSLGIDPLTGMRKRLSVSIKGSRKEAERELRRRLESVEDGTNFELTKTTVGELLTQWLEAMRSQISPRTHERYTEIVNHFLIPSCGSCLLMKLTPSAIQQIYNKWETTGRRDKKEGGLAPRTRIHIHRVFKSALKYAVQMQLIVRNPADSVKPPRAKKSSITVLTVEQATVLLQALEGTKLYWAVLLALTTGMRRGEILALRWRNVDFEKKTVRVVESLEQTKKGLRFKAPKTEKTRAVILPEYAVEKLQALKIKQEKELEAEKVTQTSESLVCGRWDGEAVHPRTITHKFVAAIKRLPNLPRVRFHDLRHSHATQLLARISHSRMG